MNRSIASQLEEQNGVDIRNPSTAIFGISSFDRYATVAERNNRENGVGGTSPNTAVISSRQNFLAGYFTRIALTEVVLRWTLPTITFNNNRMLIGYQPGGVGPLSAYLLTVTGTLGWYNPTTLAAYLQAAIRTATGNAGFLLVSDPLTGQFGATSANTDKFIFRPYVLSSEPNRIGLYEMMNWTPQSAIEFKTSQASGVPTMLRTQFVDIVCSQLTANQSVKDSDTGLVARDVLCRVYLNDGFTQDPELLGSQPFTLHRQYSFPKQIKWDPKSPVGGYLKFDLYDDQGYIISSGAGGAGGAEYDSLVIGDWNITLQLSEV